MTGYIPNRDHIGMLHQEVLQLTLGGSRVVSMRVQHSVVVPSNEDHLQVRVRARARGGCRSAMKG